MLNWIVWSRTVVTFNCEEIFDFGESDKVVKLGEKWINQTLTMGLVVIFCFPLFHLFLSFNCVSPKNCTYAKRNCLK